MLLHGAGMDLRVWRAVAPILAQRHTVHAYDARGLGHSPAPTTPFSDTADLGHVLGRFGLDDVALVGLSMGAETAVDYALTGSRRVSGLVLVNPGVAGHPWPDSPELAAYRAAQRAGRARELAELELRLWAPLGTSGPDGALISSIVWDNAARRLAAPGLAVAADSALDRLADLRGATLVVRGDQDRPEITAMAATLADRLPSVTTEVLTGADHFLPLRRPEAFADRVLSFLARRG
ncbi:alpha/beta fold hydrolase [Allokutzneria oryzae]|uniref:Alpha/beta fold hydrolase n=1 Tax=Allokutzneria oryzae TaxID=1378989 RepID=A0ABV5ZW57_9PSEU